VALETAPVSEATHGGNSTATQCTVITTKGEAARIAATLSFVSPSFYFGVLCSCFSEHHAGRNVEKSFDDLLNSAAEGSSSTTCWHHVAEVREDLSNDVPENKRISNIFPLFFVCVACNRQVCNVAVLTAPSVPAKGAVSTTSAQLFWDSNAVRTTNWVKNGIVETVQAVFATCSVAGKRASQAAATS